MLGGAEDVVAGADDVFDDPELLLEDGVEEVMAAEDREGIVMAT